MSQGVSSGYLRGRWASVAVSMEVGISGQWTSQWVVASQWPLPSILPVPCRQKVIQPMGMNPQGHLTPLQEAMSQTMEGQLSSDTDSDPD